MFSSGKKALIEEIKPNQQQFKRQVTVNKNTQFFCGEAMKK